MITEGLKLVTYDVPSCIRVGSMSKNLEMPLDITKIL